MAGDAGGVRTRGSLLDRQVLWPLSYSVIVKLAPPEGFEPPALAFVARRSGPLSYGGVLVLSRRGLPARAQSPAVFEFLRQRMNWSRQWDSNPRPPVPETGALARLRYSELVETVGVQPTAFRLQGGCSRG